MVLQHRNQYRCKKQQQSWVNTMGESQVFGDLLQYKTLSSSLGGRRAKQTHLVAKVIFDADNPTILCCYCLFSLEINMYIEKGPGRTKGYPAKKVTIGPLEKSHLTRLAPLCLPLKLPTLPIFR